MQTAPQPQPRYQIYPSLLDSYRDYLASSEIYESYWGNSESPPFSLEAFEEKQRQDLLAKINRLARERSLKADVGTVFNELVDCLVEHRPSELFERVDYLPSREACTHLSALYKGVRFSYPLELVRSFASKYAGALTQQLLEGLIETRHGWVRLYGYADELMPLSVHDIKTTGRYEPWKFKGNAQHHVYPYCLDEQGARVDSFVYDVAHIKSTISPDEQEVTVDLIEVYREEYGYQREKTIEALRTKLEDFIDWLETHRAEITDKRIFNEQ